MKKVVLFVAVLLLAGTVSLSASEFKPDIALTGEISFTFGVNLMSGATGITNAENTDLILTLIPDSANEKGGKEGETVYGWIKLDSTIVNGEANDPDGGATDGTPLTLQLGDVEGKLFLGPVYIDVNGAGTSTGYADNYGDLDLFKNYDTGDAIAGHFGLQNGAGDAGGVGYFKGTNQLTFAAIADYAPAGGANSYVTESAKNQGVSLGLTDASIVGVVVGVNSKAGYAGGNAATSNVNNVYNFKVEVTLGAVKNLGVSLAADYTTDTNRTANPSPIGLAAKASYQIDIAEGIFVKPQVAFDFKTVKSPGVAPWKLFGGVQLGLPGDTLDDWQPADGLIKWDISPGALVGFSMNNAAAVADKADSANKKYHFNNTDLTVQFYDGKLIPVVDVVAILDLYDLGITSIKLPAGNDKVASNLGTSLGVSAALGVATPWFKFEYVSPEYAGLAATPKYNASTWFSVGSDITVITNTTFTVQYVSGNLGDKSPKLGKIEFITKIDY